MGIEVSLKVRRNIDTHRLTLRSRAKQEGSFARNADH